MKFKYQIPVLIFIISGFPFLRIASQDVGIGTTTPEYKLDIAGRARLRHEGGAITAGLWFNNSANIAYAFAGMRSDSVWGLYGSGYKFNFDMDNARLSIGNVLPQYPLVFEHTLGDKISLYGGGGAPNADHYGLGIQGSLMQLFTPTSTSDIAFGYGRSGAFTERMRIKGNGNVGIGISSPLFRLDVDHSVPGLMRLTNNTTLAVNVGVEMYFKTGSYYTGAIKTIGTGTVDARLGLFTNTQANAAALIERLTISDIGNVGIGILSPLYRFDVDHSTSGLMRLTNNTTLAVDVGVEMYFKTGGAYTGAIKTIGTGAINARLGFYTNANANSASLIERLTISDLGNVGIGLTNPIRPLSFPAVLGKKISLYPGATGDAGFGVFGNELRIHSDNSSADLTFGYDTYPSTFTERVRIKGNGFVGIGTNAPAYILDVNGRMRIKHNGTTSGIWLANSTNTDDVGFIGMANDNHIGLYGDGGAGFNLVMNTTNGRVGIGTQTPSHTLSVVGTTINSAVIDSDNNSVSATGIYCGSLTSATGRGIVAEGNQYGVMSFAYGAGVNYGVYGFAANGTTNWAGYFAGNVYSTGTYQGSDRKLKSGIEPLSNSIEIINKLNPTSYTYKTIEYEQMQLPEGIQYGLIADEVKQILPGAVKKAINPAQFENNKDVNSRKIRDEVEFEAINYTQMIPILIGAIQEQQKQIEQQHQQISDQQNQIDELKKLVNQFVVNRHP